MKFFFSLFLLFSVLLGTCAAESPKYIFLFLAEGMDQTQMSLGKQIAKHSGYAWYPEYLNERGESRERDPNTWASGIVRIKEPDAAASATAIACGVRTKAGYHGVDAEQKIAPSIGYKVKSAGWKTGILSAGAVNQGPSASFFAHVADHHNNGLIALQMHLSHFDFFGGGSLCGTPLEQEIAESALQDHGYIVLHGADELIRYHSGEGKLACFSSKRPALQKTETNEDSISLARQLEAVLEFFGDQSPFFLLVEESAVGGKDAPQDTAILLSRLNEFNAAVGEAIRFQNAHANNTLILVLSTHAAGKIRFTDSQKALTDEQASLLKKQIKSLANVRREALAYHGSEKKDFDVFLKQITDDFGLTPKDIDPLFADEQKKEFEKADYNPDNLLRVLAEKRDKAAGLVWQERETTDAGQVTIHAFGAGAVLFNGTYDNTEIFHKLMQLLFPEKIQKK